MEYNPEASNSSQTPPSHRDQSDYAPNNIIKSYYNRFLEKSAQHTFQIFELNSQPTRELGIQGDIGRYGGTFYIRHADEWKVADMELDAKGRPNQVHPKLGTCRRFDAEAINWRSSTSWSASHATRIKKEKSGNSLQSTSTETTKRKGITCGEGEPQKRAKARIHEPTATGSSSLVLVESPKPQSKNPWLLDVLSLWNSHPTSVIPTHGIGQEIILALLQYPTEIPLISQNPALSSVHLIGEPTFSDGIKPTLAMVIQDMMEGDRVHATFNVLDMATGLAEDGIAASEFLSFFMQAMSAKTWSNNMRLLGALDIPFTAQGMSYCKLQANPYQSDKRTSFNKNVTWDQGFSTALTPPGSITHTHTDGIGCSQYMAHFFGRKLWLFWPPTESNMNFVGNFLDQVSPPRLTLDCIQTLEGLQLHYIDNKYSAFVLPPNYLHAVISIEASAHAGTNFCDPSHFPESLRLMKWFLGWAKNCSLYGHTSPDAIKCVTQVLDKGFGRWDQFYQQVPAARRDISRQDLDKIKIECNRILKRR